MRHLPTPFHRRSIRLKEYDYSQPGLYFVTLVADHRKEIFGSIVGNEMQLSTLGKIARDEWFQSGEIRKELRLYEDEFVVMPNHLHGIVWIVGKDENEISMDDRRESGEAKEERGILSLSARPMQRIAKSLATFVAGYKSVVTGRARRELAMSTIWQRNYYEHILRSEKEHQQIWDYIDTNPQRWFEDQLNPFAPPNPYNR